MSPRYIAPPDNRRNHHGASIIPLPPFIKCRRFVNPTAPLRSLHPTPLQLRQCSSKIYNDLLQLVVLLRLGIQEIRIEQVAKQRTHPEFTKVLCPLGFTALVCSYPEPFCCSPRSILVGLTAAKRGRSAYFGPLLASFLTVAFLDFFCGGPDGTSWGVVLVDGASPDALEVPAGLSEGSTIFLGAAGRDP